MCDGIPNEFGIFDQTNLQIKVKTNKWKLYAVNKIEKFLTLDELANEPKIHYIMSNSLNHKQVKKSKFISNLI